MQHTTPLPPRGPFSRAHIARAAIVITLAFPGIAPAREKPHPRELDALVLSALRAPTPPTQNPASVTVLDPSELESIGIFDLRDALNRAPGAISTSTAGQSGAVGSLFIRGTTTAYSQVIVDGMRLSDSNTPMGNFLGNAGISDFGRIEILRGPHGAIYGGESIGGVLWLETAAGTPDPRSQIRIEGGSFNSLSFDARHQGTTGTLAYFLSLGLMETDNDAHPSQNFRQARTALRADMKLNDIWNLRTTFRANDSYFRDPSQSENRVDSALATLQATGAISDHWTTRFHAGFYQENYDNDSAFGNFGTDLRSASFSTDQEIQITQALLLLAGGFYQRDSFENTIGVDQTRDRYGIHASLQWQPLAGLTLLQSGRWEDFAAYGDEVTWRTGAAYHFDQAGLTLRGGTGSSFRTPSYLDLFGSAFGVGNPSLRAESARGWDIGFVQSIGGNHHIEVTGFETHIRQRIRSFPTPPQNLAGTSKTRGIEVGLRGNWLDGHLTHHLAWTWTDESLAGIPRNAINASLDWKPDEKTLLGIGVQHFSTRTWGGSPLSSATLTRIHASRQITENLRLHARVENLFNESYQLSDFFGTVVQGAGTGVHLGITATW